MAKNQPQREGNNPGGGRKGGQGGGSRQDVNRPQGSERPQGNRKQSERTQRDR